MLISSVRKRVVHPVFDRTCSTHLCEGPLTTILNHAPLSCPLPRRLLLFLVSTHSSSILRTPLCSFLAAMKSGVWPDGFVVLELTSFRSSSIFVTPSWPLQAAIKSGVGTFFFAVLGLISARSSGIFMTLSYPFMVTIKFSAVFCRPPASPTVTYQNKSQILGLVILPNDGCLGN